jgi:hypothetical protein
MRLIEALTDARLWANLAPPFLVKLGRGACTWTARAMMPVQQGPQAMQNSAYWVLDISLALALLLTLLLLAALALNQAYKKLRARAATTDTHYKHTAATHASRPGNRKEPLGGAHTPPSHSPARTQLRGQDYVIDRMSSSHH